MIVTLPDVKSERHAHYLIDQLFEAKKKFKPRSNKAFGSIYHRLTIALMKRYGHNLHDLFQKAKAALILAKKSTGTGAEFHQVLVALKRDIHEFRSVYVQAAYLIGRERGISALRKRGIIKEAAKDWSIDFETKKVKDNDGKEHTVEVPVLNIDLNPTDERDVKRIDEMINGTEFSIGQARYTGKQRGPFVDVQINKLNDRLNRQMTFEDMADREPSETWPPDSLIIEELDKMDAKAAFWDSELWAVEEKGFLNELREVGEENKQNIKVAWAGPEDSNSCDYCLDAMANSPYDVDDVPEPGEGECQCNCRHMTVFFDADEVPEEGGEEG